MNGFRIMVYRLTDKDEGEKGTRESSEEVYEQKVESLDMQALIGVVNGLSKRTP